jgi:D-xylose transport system permease protein
MTANPPDSVTDAPATSTTARAVEEAERMQGALPADLQDERLIASRGIRGSVAAFTSRLKSGDLGPLPVVVGLVVIWAVFQSLNGAFLSSRNLVNLTQQSAAVGTIAIGIVLVLMLGEIDLSVGSVSGLSGAVMAVLFVQHHLPLWVSVLVGLLTGTVIGLVYGALFTRFGVPSFVITLAGLLAILGMQLFVLGTIGSINIPFTSPIVSFAQLTFLPPAVSYLLIVLAAGAYVVSRLRGRAQRSAAGLSSTTVAMIAMRTAALAVVLAVPAYVLNRDRGVSAMFVLFLALVVVTDFALRRTRWGRSVTAVGGNVEAARRAGLNVRGIYLSVFTLCSTFAALGGLLAAARLAAANQNSGTGDTNLNAIAAAVIGGTSLFGGRGSAYAALLGIIVIQSISSGLSLLNLDSSVRFMVTGAVLLLAVTIDSLSRRSRASHGRA